MYGTSEVRADDARPFFTVGISENVVIKSADFENSRLDGTGSDVLAFTFMQPNGAIFRKIVWEVDPIRVAKFSKDYPRMHSRNNEKAGYVKGEVITDEQSVRIAYDDFNRFIKHILTKYMSEEEATITNVKSYKDFCMMVIKKLSGKLDKKIRLKTVYNSNGYLDLPRYGNFIEPMDIEISTLAIGPKDNIERATPTDENKVESAVTAKVTNDLPF